MRSRFPNFIMKNQSRFGVPVKLWATFSVIVKCWHVICSQKCWSFLPLLTGFLTAVNYSLRRVYVAGSTTSNTIAPVDSSFEHPLTKTENLKEAINYISLPALAIKMMTIWVHATNNIFLSLVNGSFFRFYLKTGLNWSGFWEDGLNGNRF